jgi:hypothetical protein
MSATHAQISQVFPSIEAAAPAQAKPSSSRRAVIAGRVLSTLAVLFLTFDASVKLFNLMPEEVAKNSLGFPLHLMSTIGALELLLLALYLVPRTAVLGAVLWTGYLGGAVAAHVRIESPLLSHTLFPIYIAALIWGGLWLRDARARALLAKR